MSELDDLTSAQVDRPQRRRKRRPIKRQKNFRPAIWIAAPTAIVLSIVGLFGLSSEQRVFTYPEAVVNDDLVRRMPIGDGSTQLVDAVVSLGGNALAFQAIGRGSVSSYRATVNAQPSFFEDQCTIIARNPETTIDNRRAHSPSMGEQAADAVSGDIGFVDTVVRVVVSPVDTWEDRSTLNKTRLLANALPVFEMPGVDCDFASTGSVDRVSVRNGAIEVVASRWTLGTRGIVFLAMLLISSMVFAWVWLDRDFGKIG